MHHLVSPGGEEPQLIDGRARTRDVTVIEAGGA
jgi:hypothetical protein